MRSSFSSHSSTSKIPPTPVPQHDSRDSDRRTLQNRYISNIEMPGGTIRYVPLHPPKDGATRTSSAAEWTIDFEELESTINSKTKMIVSLLSISGHSLLTLTL